MNAKLVALLVASTALACGQLTATWDQTPEKPAIRAFGVGEADLPEPSADGGAAGGPAEPIPHPAGCGDRLGSGFVRRDTNATCELPSGDDAVVANGGKLPSAALGVPALVLGDSILLAVDGATQASLYDLYTGQESLSLTLSAGFVAPQAAANESMICLAIGAPQVTLECFDRKLGKSLWTLQVSFQGKLSDLRLEQDMLWLEHSQAGVGELVAVNAASGSVVFRRASLGVNGGIVRVGADIVGYDQDPCAELAAPAACLRAIDAKTGETRATSAVEYPIFAWQSGDQAVFSDGTDQFQYSASSGSFSTVTAELAPIVEGLGSARWYAEGEALADGRVLITVAGATSELVVVDPASKAFKRLGVPGPKLLRVHADLLVADGVVVSLTDAQPPTTSASSWFGIFGFEPGSATYARKIQ